MELSSVSRGACILATGTKECRLELHRPRPGEIVFRSHDQAIVSATGPERPSPITRPHEVGAEEASDSQRRPR